MQMAQMASLAIFGSRHRIRMPHPYTCFRKGWISKRDPRRCSSVGSGKRAPWSLDSTCRCYAAVEKDVLAPDTPPSCTTCTYSLSDFFGSFTTKYAFQSIPLPSGYTQYTAQWFEDFGTHAGDPAPSDPDDDAVDPHD
jgi:hypothetical protein